MLRDKINLARTQPELYKHQWWNPRNLYKNFWSRLRYKLGIAQKAPSIRYPVYFDDGYIEDKTEYGDRRGVSFFEWWKENSASHNLEKMAIGKAQALRFLLKEIAKGKKYKTFKTQVTVKKPRKNGKKRND